MTSWLHHVMPGHVMPRMPSCHARVDVMSCQGLHAVISCLTPCCAAMIIMSCGQLYVCVGQSGHIQLHRCCADWWTGLMLCAAVIAVRGVSSKPIRPPSGFHAGVIIERVSCLHHCSKRTSTSYGESGQRVLACPPSIHASSLCVWS